MPIIRNDLIGYLWPLEFADFFDNPDGDFEGEFGWESFKEWWDQYGLYPYEIENRPGGNNGYFIEHDYEWTGDYRDRDGLYCHRFWFYRADIDRLTPRGAAPPIPRELRTSVPPPTKLPLP